MDISAEVTVNEDFPANKENSPKENGWLHANKALFGLLAGLVVLALLSERKRDITALPAWFITTCGCVVGSGHRAQRGDERGPDRRRVIDDLRRELAQTLEQAAVRRRYGVTIVKVRSADGEWRAAGASSVISAGDLLIVIGPVEATERFAALR
mgnify:CR=1 FL=1